MALDRYRRPSYRTPGCTRSGYRKPTSSGRTRTTRLGRVALAASTALVVTAVSGCGLLGGSADQGGDSGGANGLEKSHLNVGVLKAIDVAAVHIAQEDGFFQQEGLDVNLQSLSGGKESIPALLNGSLDVAWGSWTNPMGAEAKGAAQSSDGIKIISDGYQGKSQTMNLVTTPGSGIQGVKDLKGKKIAVNAATGLPALSLNAILEANNINPASVQYTKADYSEMPGMLAKGDVAGAVMLEPYLTKAQRELGTVPVVDLFGPGPTQDMPIAGLSTTGKFMQENPKTAEAFQRAVAKGAQKASSDRKRVEEVLMKDLKMDPETASLVHLGTFPEKADAKRLQRVGNLMLNYGQLDKPLDVASMIPPQHP